MAIPQIGADGVRQTINANLSPLEAVWNFRSGWNVAALNCLEAKHSPILDGYRSFLTGHKTRLRAVNRSLDQQYRRDHGSRATREREAYMTQVYNYFSLPPARDYFCRVALEISQEMLLAPSGDTDSFALAALPRMEAAFDQFYRDYERYYVDVAEWDARYGARYGAGQGAVYTGAVTGAPDGSSAAVPLSAEGPVVQPVP